jgi:hypothetical protein
MTRIRAVQWDALNPNRTAVKIRFSRGRPKDDTRELNRMLKRFAKGGGRGHPGPAGPAFDPKESKQFCVVKMNYSMKQKSHEKFLNDYLVQAGKESVVDKPAAFGTEDYRAHMTAKHYKFIISPDSQGLDNAALVRQLVGRMEAETGYKFHWRAAVHTDTAQRHAHLLINGKDRQGKPVWFARDFVRRRVRELSREISTAMAGERTAEQKRAYAEKSFSAKRWTKWDEEIEKYTLAAPANNNERWTEFIRYAGETQRRRLGELAKIGVARFVEGNRYEMEKNWKETLKTAGRYNTFLEEKKKVRNLELWESKNGKIEGTVQKVLSMNDEDVWNNAVVVRNEKTGKAWYVPLFNPAYANLAGKTVTIEGKPDAKGRTNPAIAVTGGKTAERA